MSGKTNKPWKVVAGVTALLCTAILIDDYLRLRSTLLLQTEETMLRQEVDQIIMLNMPMEQAMQQLNARRYRVEKEGDKLFISKGLSFYSGLSGGKDFTINGVLRFSGNVPVKSQVYVNASFM